MKGDRVLLVGNFGARNIGDELILCHGLDTEPRAHVMTVDPAWSQSFCERGFETVPFPPSGIRSCVRWCFSSSYRRTLAGLRHRYDRVIFIGGGLFAIRFRACWLWWCVFRFCRKGIQPAEIHFEYQGVGDDLGFFSRILTRWVFTRADSISVRDESSARVVAALIGSTPPMVRDRVEVLLEHQKPSTADRPHRVLLEARSVFDWKILEPYFREMEVIYTCFDPSDRRWISTDFHGEVCEPRNFHEVVQLFTDADMVVGERYHFLLLGVKFCGAKRTFLLREPYADKVASFAEYAGVKDVRS